MIKSRVAITLVLSVLFTNFLFVIAYTVQEPSKLNVLQELDKFINEPDPVYSYKLISKTETEAFTFYKLHMTSQEYLPDITSKPVWEHDLKIVVPTTLGTKRAVMFSEGTEEQEYDALQAMMAVQTRAIVVALYQVPNQPLSIKLANGTWTKGLHEDHLVGAFWYKFLYEKQDPRYMIHWAMAKAVIRAMDTAQTVLKDQLEIEGFVVTGFSKRGWLTYFAAAADKRVTGIVPAVIDVLNFNQAVHRIHGALCKWPLALQPYIEWGFAAAMGTPAFETLTQFVDPLSYNARLRNVDAFLVSASGDQFFLTATENVGYNQLLSKRKYFTEEINGGHGGYDIVPQLQVMLYQNMSVPDIHWTREEANNGDVTIQLSILAPSSDDAPAVFKKPKQVAIWTAYNPKARDFRLRTVPTDPKPPKFVATTLEPVYAAGPLFRYKATVPYKEGFTAYNVEVTYDNPFDAESIAPLKFNTNSFVNPSVPPCSD